MNSLLSLLSAVPAWQYCAIFAVFVLAGLVKGAIGLGLPTVSVGLLSLFMAPLEASALLIIPSFFTNVWQAASGTALKDILRRIWIMLIAACIGTALGVACSYYWRIAWLTNALGVALMAYAASSMWSGKWNMSAQSEQLWGPVVGICTGIIAGATGVFVLPAVPYLRALNLSRDDLLQAMGVSFTVSTVALAAFLAAEGEFHLQSASISCLALIPSCLGMVLGQRLARAMDPLLFRRVFFSGLFLLGCYFAIGVER